MASTPEGRLVVEYLRHTQDINVEKFIMDAEIYTSILNKTQAETFSDELRQLKAITSMQHNEGESLKDNYKRNKFLYEIIFKKDAVEQLINALEKSDNLHIVKKLKTNIPEQQQESNKQRQQEYQATAAAPKQSTQSPLTVFKVGRTMTVTKKIHTILPTTPITGTTLYDARDLHAGSVKTEYIQGPVSSSESDEDSSSSTD